MNIFHLVLLTTVAVAGSMTFASELDQLSPHLPPVVGTGGTANRMVAVVFPRSNAAQVVLLREGKVEANSMEFDFPMEANYGALWVEQIKVHSQTSFTLRVRARQTCGPGVYDYSFSQIAGTWRLSSLEREEASCSDAGVVPAWRRSYDYLNERVVHTEFKKNRPPQPVAQRKPFPVFALAEFVPLSLVYEP